MNNRVSSAIRSKGTSPIKDLDVLTSLAHQYSQQQSRIIDLGCGRGNLLKNLKDRDHLFAADIHDFTDGSIPFYACDLNDEFSKVLPGQYDMVIASHLVLYLENLWSFGREIFKILNTGGIAVIANSNPESLRSLMSYCLRGYHCYAPPRYPEHIQTPSIFEMEKVFLKDSMFTVINRSYSGHGQLPSTHLFWQSFLPFLKGKRFSDSYFLVIKKN